MIDGKGNDGDDQIENSTATSLTNPNMEKRAPMTLRARSLSCCPCVFAADQCFIHPSNRSHTTGGLTAPTNTY